MENQNKIILRTYGNIWNTPFKIYSIDRVKLLVPVNPWDVVYYMAGLVVAAVLDFIYPGELEFMWKYVVIPLAVRFILARVKLDGKRPHRFFWSTFLYLINKGNKEFFKPVKKQALRNFKGEEITCLRAARKQVFYRKTGDKN
jgi:hypothetical protein